jgi:hypothetical protein
LVRYFERLRRGAINDLARGYVIWLLPIFVAAESRFHVHHDFNTRLLFVFLISTCRRAPSPLVWRKLQRLLNLKLTCHPCTACRRTILWTSKSPMYIQKSGKDRILKILFPDRLAVLSATTIAETM